MDDELRRLERAARAGDPNADLAFRRALARAGTRYPLDMIDAEKLRFLARMNAPEREEALAILRDIPFVPRGDFGVRFVGSGTRFVDRRDLDPPLHLVPIAGNWSLGPDDAAPYFDEIGWGVFDFTTCEMEKRSSWLHRLRTRVAALDVLRLAARDLVMAQAPGDAGWDDSNASLEREILAVIPTDTVLHARRQQLVSRFRSALSALLAHLRASVGLLENSAAFVEYVPIHARMVDKATTAGESTDEVDLDLLSSLALEDAAALGFSRPPDEVIADEDLSTGAFWAEGRFSRSDINELSMRFIVGRLLAWLREDVMPTPTPRNERPRGRRLSHNPDLPCQIVNLTDHSPELRPQARSLFQKTKIRHDDSEELFEACVAPDGSVVGASVVGLYDKTPDDGDDMRRPRWTFSVAVAEDHRRKGIARALVRSIMAAHPRETVLLEGKVVNPLMADLLKSLGFYFYDQEEAEDEWTDHQRSWGRRMYLPNPRSQERRYSDAEIDDLRARYAVAKKRSDELSKELRDDDRHDYDAIWELYKAANDEAAQLHWPIHRELQLRAGARSRAVSLPDSGHYPDLMGDPEDLRGASDPVPRPAPDGYRHYVYDRGRVHLFQRVVGDKVVSGLTVVARRPRDGVQSGAIDRVNTHPAYRRKGYAADLLRYARSIMRRVRHSHDLTSDGRAWKGAVRNAPTRKNSDAGLRDLERAAASGGRDAMVRLDLERHRHGMPSVFGWLVENGMAADLAHRTDYVPAHNCLANREQGRQEEAIDEIGRRVLGEQYWSYATGQDGWSSGSRHLATGAVETELDGLFSRHVGFRDNRDHGQWLGRMEELASALEGAGYRVYWVERAGAIRDAFVPLDAGRIKLARDLGEEYASALRAMRSRR